MSDDWKTKDIVTGRVLAEGQTESQAEEMFLKALRLHHERFFGSIFAVSGSNIPQSFRDKVAEICQVVDDPTIPPDMLFYVEGNPSDYTSGAARAKDA